MNFFVVDFDTTYHAILGRPALTKFMAMPHYVYLVLKIPMEQGILTLRANVSTAYECEREGLTIAEAMDLSARMEACITDSKKVHTYKSYDPTSIIGSTIKMASTPLIHGALNTLGISILEMFY